ncbi:MAG: STAS domain-containing protein [Parachlamydiales bacterium]
MAVQFSQEKVGEGTLLRLEGRMDAATSPAVDTKIGALLQGGVEKLILSFKGVDYLSSAGMRVILAASKKLAAKKGKLLLCELKPQVLEVLKLAGFDRILEIVATEQEARSQL